jgi:hypothetical protein
MLVAAACNSSAAVHAESELSSNQGGRHLLSDARVVEVLAHVGVKEGACVAGAFACSHGAVEGLSFRTDCAGDADGEDAWKPLLATA